MAGPEGRYLLVSDSNGSHGQYESKKLGQEELSRIAEDHLFKKHLGTMSDWLTISQYVAQRGVLDERLSRLLQELRQVPETQNSRFKPVDGQVVLLHKEETDKATAEICAREGLPSLSPLEYLKRHWDIPRGFAVEQIQDCMLRGVTEVGSASVLRPGNLNVRLSEGNMPPHAHHSGILSSGTSGGIQSAEGVQSAVVSFDPSGLVYDMFYNDSIAVGMDKNELDGAIDRFAIQEAGSDSVTHNNLPRFERFYAFAFKKSAA